MRPFWVEDSEGGVPIRLSAVRRCGDETGTRPGEPDDRSGAYRAAPPVVTGAGADAARPAAHRPALLPWCRRKAGLRRTAPSPPV